MPAATLLQMATRIAMRNAANIEGFSNMPYELVKPILKKIDAPNKLKEIEHNTPELREHNADLWKEFIKRHIPKGDQIVEEVDITNPAKWRTYYFKLLKEKEKQEQEDEARLEAAMKGLTKQKEENKASFVSKVIPQKSKGSAFVDGQRNPKASSWGIVGGPPALKNAKSGSDALAAIRRQTRDAVNQRPGWSGSKSMSTIRTPAPRNQIKEAPAWMVQQAAGPKTNTALLQAAKQSSANVKKPGVFAQANNGPSGQEMAIRNAEREARLRALTQNKTKPAASPPAATSKAPPPAVSPPRQASPPKTAPFTMPTSGSQPVKRTAASPPNEPSPKPPVAPAAASKTASPNPATVSRKRPANGPSVFMPAKKKKT